MSSAFSYRVKFRDIRIKPPAEEASRARAKTTGVCEHAGCDLAGEHPAPRNDGQVGKFWFCADHASEYNRNFDFFRGWSEADIEAFMVAAAYGHKRTWRFGQGPMGGTKAASTQDPRRWRGKDLFDFEGNAEAAAADASRRARSSLQVRALAELDLPDNATAADIRARYAEYVRRFHPDSNGGDRAMEHKLSRVIRAWKTLKAAGLTKG